MSRENYFVPEDVDAFGFDWGKLSLTVGAERMEQSASPGGVVDLASGQATRHNHPGAKEIIFVISGRGEQMVEDPDVNPVTRDVGPSCTV